MRAFEAHLENFLVDIVSFPNMILSPERAILEKFFHHYDKGNHALEFFPDTYFDVQEATSFIMNMSYHLSRQGYLNSTLCFHENNIAPQLIMKIPGILRDIARDNLSSEECSLHNHSLFYFNSCGIIPSANAYGIMYNILDYEKIYKTNIRFVLVPIDVYIDKIKSDVGKFTDQWLGAKNMRLKPGLTAIIPYEE